MTKSGEYVYQIPIEAKINSIPTIKGSMLVGENEKYVGCLLFSDESRVNEELKEKAPPKENIGKDPYYGMFLKGKIEEVNSTLPRSQKIKRFVVVTDEQEVGEMTEKKRQEIEDKYKPQITLLFRPKQ
ncbi:Long-chain fatty acid--CoA ligase [Entamoeba marina]